jgi:hypothetical protein
LAEYIGIGGEVWLAGGGGALASLANFDRLQNNTVTLTVFTARDDELGPGRPMYDAAHVRSALAVARSSFAFARSPAAVGGWSGHGPDGSLSAPDYSRAPAVLRPRDPGSDPLPPTRFAGQEGQYYFDFNAAGFVTEPNSISEDFGVGVQRIESALDTVYETTTSPVAAPGSPAMLYYHGRENAPFVYTGFDPWTCTRADGQALVDFVLGEIWKVPKSTPGVRAARTSSVRSAAPARRLDPRTMRP